MPRFACTKCGQVSDQRRCEKHRGNTSWGGTRDRSTQRRFRTLVLNNAGNRCQAIEHGARCSVMAGLVAHHIDGDTANNTAENGAALCEAHHRAIDARAR